MEKLIKEFMQDNFKCDGCGATDKALRVKSVEMFGSELRVTLSCNECDAEWTEVFNLDQGYIGYIDADDRMHYDDENDKVYYAEEDEEEEEE